MTKLQKALEAVRRLEARRAGKRVVEPSLAEVRAARAMGFVIVLGITPVVTKAGLAALEQSKTPTPKQGGSR